MMRPLPPTGEPGGDSSHHVWVLNVGVAAETPPRAWGHLEEPRSLWSWCLLAVGVTQMGWFCLFLGWAMAARAVSC